MKLRTVVGIWIALIIALSAVRAAAGGLSPNVQTILYQWYRTAGYDGYWRHWDGSGTGPPEDLPACFYPYLGAYSSADPAVVEKHMEWMRRAGIGVVLLDVWNTGSYEETPSLGSMDAAAAKGIRCGFYLEPYHVGGSYRRIGDVREQMAYLEDTYGDHPAACKLSRATKWGTSTAPRLIMGGFCDFIDITSGEWAAFMDSIRGTRYDVLYLGGGDPAFMDAAHWDGMNSYSPFFNPSDYASTNNAVTSRGGVWAATVSPGFDNTCAGGTLVQSHDNGARYDAMWNGARSANPEFVHVVSFNEWHESTIIEPAQPKTIPSRTYQDYGALGPFYYLDRTAYWKNQWKGTSIENAAFMADTIPSAMEAGETRSVTVVMMNTGDTTWTRAGEYRLGGYGDSDPFAATRHYMDASASVGTFEVYPFTFTFTAPATPGTYHTDWQMVHELVRWFGDIKPYKDITVFPVGGAYNAEWVTDTIPSTMVKGQSRIVSITMRNSGASAWNASDGCALAAVGGSDRFAAASQPLGSGETVPPGATKTFTFAMTAPAHAGYYSTDWRMSRTGTGLFGREAKKIIVVTDPSILPPVADFAAVSGNGQVALSWTNPSDWDLTRVMIRWSTSGYPASISDGVLLADDRQTPEANAFYIHTGLPNGVSCYYTAFAHDGIGNYARAARAAATPWNLSTVMISNSAFASSSDGWSTATWRAGSSSAGTMAWNASAGNPGGAMRSTGYGTTDDTNRCYREGGEIYKVIPTTGYRNIRVSYDLRVNSLGSNRTGIGTGSCVVDHNLIDEQLTVFYSINGGANWIELEYLTRSTLLSYQTYGTRTLDLSGIPAASNNPSFALRFRWQFNTASDTGDLDNIVVTGNVADIAPPAGVTNFTAVAGDGQVALTWTNPSDGDYVGTLIVCKTSGYPTGPGDGTPVVEKANSPGSSDSFIHTGLSNWQTYYYSAFARDFVPNYAPPAQASATPTAVVCLSDSFSYPNGWLNGNGGWTGTATDQIAVDSQAVKISAGAGWYDAIAPTYCAPPICGVWVKARKGFGSYASWALYVDDTANKNLARWFGGGDNVRGRVGSSIWMTASKTLTGGWDDLYIRINFAANTSAFYFNGALLSTLSHVETGAGDAVGRIRLEHSECASGVGQYLHLDDLSVGVHDSTGPVAAVSAPSASVTRTGPVAYEVTFNEPVYGFDSPSDLTINSTGSAAAGAVGVSGSGAGPYTVTLSGITGGGTLGITVRSGRCFDKAANSNPASTTSQIFRVLSADGSIGAAKALGDEAPVELGNKALYLRRPGFAYIEEPDRTCGIRLQGSFTANEGDLVCLSGTMKTTLGGERYILADLVSAFGPLSIDPLGLSNSALASSLACGLYVKAWGCVEAGSITENSFVITDGFGPAGIRIITPGPPGVQPGDFVTVTGAAGYDNARVIYRK